MDLIRGPAPGPAGAVELDVALAHELVRRTGRAGEGAVLRLYRPQRPTVAFSRRDTLSPGFPGAVQAARDAGFAPVVRAPGGRVVAYTERSVVVDHIAADADAIGGLDRRFQDFGGLWVDVLQSLGADARLGAVPGEYCPGAYSVNARGLVKLVGTAQRVVRGAWLFSAVAILDDADVLAPLLTTIHGHLDLPFDSASVGSVRGELPGLAADRLEDALLEAYDRRCGLLTAALDDEVVEAAVARVPEHRIA